MPLVTQVGRQAGRPGLPVAPIPAPRPPLPRHGHTHGAQPASQPITRRPNASQLQSSKLCRHSTDIPIMWHFRRHWPDTSVLHLTRPQLNSAHDKPTLNRLSLLGTVQELRQFTLKTEVNNTDLEGSLTLPPTYEANERCQQSTGN